MDASKKDVLQLALLEYMVLQNIRGRAIEKHIKLYILLILQILICEGYGIPMMR